MGAEIAVQCRDVSVHVRDARRLRARDVGQRHTGMVDGGWMVAASCHTAAQIAASC